CSRDSVVPAADPALGWLPQWIEFGNRLLSVAVGVLAVLVVLTALAHRPRRRRYLLLAGAVLAGVVVQAVIGGLSVLAELRWWTVAPHLLISAGLVWLAVLLLRAVPSHDRPRRSAVPRPLRALLAAQAGLLVAILVAGTLVTAAGPHAGDPGT